jgi:hypothetical protein
MIPRGLCPIVVVEVVEVVEVVDMLDVVVVVGPWPLTPVMVAVVVEEEAKDEVEMAEVTPAPPLDVAGDTVLEVEVVGMVTVVGNKDGVVLPPSAELTP